MKRGFTLIELLAVIVILAIIALIATPIILGIIKDAREEANLRSAENYLKAAELSIMRESLTNEIDTSTCEVQSNGNLVCGTKTVTVEVENTTATSGTLTFTEGKLTNVEGLVIGPNTYNMNSNGKLVKAGPVSYVCRKQGTASQTIGAEYICSLDTDRTFYVLKVNTDTIDLIMDRNYTDSNVPMTVKWCESGDDGTTCNGITRYVTYIQTAFGSNVTVSIPTCPQIYAVNNSDTLTSTPWLYDYLRETTHPVSDAYGYWTASVYADRSYSACFVFYYGNLNTNDVDISNGGGVRPVITVSKSLMN